METKEELINDKTTSLHQFLLTSNTTLLALLEREGFAEGFDRVESSHGKAQKCRISGGNSCKRMNAVNQCDWDARNEWDTRIIAQIYTQINTISIEHVLIII